MNVFAECSSSGSSSSSSSSSISSSSSRTSTSSSSSSSSSSNKDGNNLGVLVCFTRREYEDTAVALGLSRLRRLRHGHSHQDTRRVGILESLRRQVEGADFSSPPAGWMRTFERTLFAVAEEAQATARGGAYRAGSAHEPKRRPMHVVVAE